MRIIDLDNGNYRFTTDSGKEITLSEFELLGLLRLAGPYQDQLKAQREGHKHYPAATARIEKVVVSLDSHRTEVVLRFVHARGGEDAYVIAPDIAEDMRDGLTVKLEQIETAKRNRTNN